MPIKENPTRIEFSYYDEDGREDDKYQIVYDSSWSSVPISVTLGKDTIHFSVNFFEEMYTFLNDKGLIKSKIPNKPIPRNNNTGISFPEIIKENKKEENNNTINADKSTNKFVDPIASFDISHYNKDKPNDEKIVKESEENSNIKDADSISANKNEDNNKEGFSLPADLFPEDMVVLEPSVKVAGKEVTGEVVIPKRPVIKSRIKSGDDLSADREAAMIRNEMVGEKVKKITRRED